MIDLPALEAGFFMRMRGADMATLEEVLASVTTLLARYSAALSVDGGSKLLTLDRTGTGDTAAVVLQQGGAERFRMGQIGADTFALQRSPSGAAVDYTDVLSVNRSTGAVTLAGATAITGNATLSGYLFADADDWRVMGNTTSGLDTRRITLVSGGSLSATRGAYLMLHGINHPSNPGLVRVSAGNGYNAEVIGQHAVLNGIAAAVLQVGSVEYARLTTAGLAIGLSTPLYRLDVNSGPGDIVARFASSDAGAFIDLRDNVTGAGYVRYGAVGDAAVIWAGNSERARIDSAGRLLIGTTASGGSKLRISGLPTSSTGLSAGDIWNDGGTLKVA